MNRAKHVTQLSRIFFSYLRRKKTCNYYPSRLWIEPTNRCNLRCKMCLNKELSQSDFGFMDVDMFKQIIDELTSHSYDIYVHHRGESLLHPRLAEMIGYAHSNKIRTRLHTNATLLDKDKSEQLLDSGLDFLSFSFDGYSKEEYESIRIKANYEDTLKNIKNFLTLKKERGASKPYVSFTVIEFKEHSPKERREFLKQFDGLPLNDVRIRKPHNWGGSYEDPGVNKDKSVFLPCTFPWYSLTIFWDGTVLPCPQDFFGKLKLGNVKDAPIFEIWNSDKMIELRTNMTKDSAPLLTPCNECDRIYRKGFLGIPLEGIKPFLKDNLFQKP